MSLVWLIAWAALLTVALVSLCAVLSLRVRARKVERWLVSEMAALRAKLDALEKPSAPLPQAQRPAARPQAMQQQAAPQQPTPPAVKPPRPREEVPERPGDLVATLNEMLKGNQPYNFVEALHAMDPRLTLLRLTPRSGMGAWSRDVVLEHGGDGLFACAQGNRALLFPNYSRFSATLDPAPLYDGARHGGRIHSILRPAVLEKQADETWLLVEKGRVQMRQGSA